MVEKVLKSVFGIDSSISEINIKGLPLYMTTGRKLRKVDYGEDVFLLVELPEDRFGVISLEKQYRKYREKSEMNVAFYFDKLTKLQRDSLIAKRIPFLSIPDQLYLPFLGIVISNNFRKESNLSAEKMMPATQALFLYLLYQKKEYVLKKKAAEDLGLTRTSITRASEQLKKMGLISEIREGKEIHMIPVSFGRKLFIMAERYLINPVQKRIFINGEKKYSHMCKAGEYALSENSLLNQPEYKVYAIFKNRLSDMEIQEINPKWEQNDSVCELEVWKYNPELFSFDGSVDPVSLALSLRDNEDERVQGEMEDYLEVFEW